MLDGKATIMHVRIFDFEEAKLGHRQVQSVLRWEEMTYGRKFGFTLWTKEFRLISVVRAFSLGAYHGQEAENGHLMEEIMMS